MYLRSFWESAETAPYSAPVTPSVINTGDQKEAPSGSSVMPTRRMPNAPSFIKTPACSIETPVGAATWPSGDQVCSGHMPASTPKPIMKNGKHHFWKLGSSFAARITVISNVPAPACTNNAKMPMKTNTEPATSISVSFIAPYSLVRVNVPKSELAPQTAISRYIGSTATSYQKKKKKRSSVMNTP